jgi:RNA polymerase sigma-70 factor (ECF subfamily)
LQPSDQDLVARVIGARDEEAFRLLFRRHTPRVYAVALRLMARRESEAEEVVQEMWRRAATRLGAFQWQSALSTWLRSIAFNCARERLRIRPILQADDAALAALPAAATSPALALDLERAIASLPDRCRAAFVLHDIEGYTHEEIAGLLEIAAGTSKSHLFHARRLLRARLTAAPPARTDRHGR